MQLNNKISVIDSCITCNHVACSFHFYDKDDEEDDDDDDDDDDDADDDESHHVTRKNESEVSEGRQPAWEDDADEEERYKDFMI